MTDERRTMAQFIADNNLTMTSKATHAIPEDGPTWAPNCTHWRCTLRMHGRQWTIRFHMGAAHTEPPDLPTVLGSLSAECASIEHAEGFRDWCSEMGFDPTTEAAPTVYGDAWTTFHACARQARSARKFMADEYDALLWHTDED